MSLDQGHLDIFSIFISVMTLTNRLCISGLAKQYLLSQYVENVSASCSYSKQLGILLFVFTHTYDQGSKENRSNSVKTDQDHRDKDRRQKIDLVKSY